MLDVVKQLFERFNQEGIRTCHWKSNHVLNKALDGEGDLDLLFRSQDRVKVERVFRERGLIEGREANGGIKRNVCHYFGYDNITLKWVHIHSYYQLVTGGSLVKNYHFPHEDRILADSVQTSGVGIPLAIQEYQLFVIRKILESASILESAMLMREYGAMLQELSWHRGRMLGLSELEYSKGCFSNEVSIQMLTRASVLLEKKKSWFGRLFLGRRMAKHLSSYRLKSSLIVSLQRIKMMFIKVIRRLGRRRGLNPVIGGMVIALVGPDASGKSTISCSMARIFSEYFDVQMVHPGKPPASPFMFVPRLFRRIIRTFYYNDRAIDKNKFRSLKVITRRSLIYSLRCVVIALDRWFLLLKMKRAAHKGTIVICDRYPGSSPGDMDGPEIRCNTHNVAANFLASIEEWFYSHISRPDVVIKLSVPIEVAMKRNKTKKGMEADTDEYLKQIYSQPTIDLKGNYFNIEIDSNEEKINTERKAFLAVWNTMCMVNKGEL